MEIIMSQEDVKGEMIFGQEAVLRLWQQSATRMMRANERLMRGMADMANCQVELGQTLIQHHLDALKFDPNDDSFSDFAPVHVERYRNRVEHTTASMQKSVCVIAIFFSKTTQEFLQNMAIDDSSTPQINDKPRTTPRKR
jgi:hypothetical protein